MKIVSVIGALLCATCITATAHEWPTLAEMQQECGPYFTKLQEARAAGLQGQDPGLVFMHALCSQPELLKAMSAAEQQALRSLDTEAAAIKAKNRARMSPEEVEKSERFMRELYNNMRATGCQAPDPAVADREIRQLWGTMRTALARNDIEGAVACFHEHARDDYRRNFERLSSRLPSLAEELGEPADGQVGGNLAEYRLYRDEDGRRYSFDLRLALDENCQWKIVSY
jgi:hypothetical protein